MNNAIVAKSKEYLFELELRHIDISPFKEILSKEPHYTSWLEEFKKAPLKPSVRLYVRKEYTDEQIEVGIYEGKRASTEFLNRMGDLHNEFHKLVAKNNLPEQYYINDIKETNIYKTLKGIEKNFNILKEEAIEKENANTEIRVKGIIQYLSELKNNTLSKEVVETLINDNLNIHSLSLFIKNPLAATESKSKWESVKSHFNILLKDYLNTLNPNQSGLSAVNQSRNDYREILSAPEIALRHYIMYKNNKEHALSGTDLAKRDGKNEKYPKRKDMHNIRKHLPVVEERGRNNGNLGTKKQLLNIKSTLEDYTDVQQYIDGLIAKLN